MNRVAILIRFNGLLLESFSRRTTAALRASLPLPLALPWLDRLLDLNVDKEINKDALVITRAAKTLASGKRPDDEDALDLLEGSKDIDRAFLAKLGGAPLEILIRYQSVDTLRIDRIRRLLAASYRILAAWKRPLSLGTALEAAFPGDELEHAILIQLTLYARETQVLGNSVRMPLLLTPLRNRLVDGLYSTLKISAAVLARDAASRIKPSNQSVAGESTGQSLRRI